MKRYEMIKDKDYFSHIIKCGNYAKDKLFVIYYINNDNGRFSHFGIAIKRSIGKSYVRNKLKRQVRMIVTTNKNLFKLSQDYIIMIRDECIHASFEEMQESILKLLKGDNL